MIKNVRRIGAVAALLSVFALHAPADAAQVNVAASGLHTQLGGGDTILYFGTSAAAWTGSNLTMIAELPRVPGSSGVTVWVDGWGVSGTYTCSLIGSNASKSFSKSSLATNWTQSVNFTAAEMPSSSYLTISCSVPPDGALRGITISG